MKHTSFFLIAVIFLFAGCTQSDPAVKTAAVDTGDLFAQAAVAGASAPVSTPAWDEVIIEKNPGPGPYEGAARGHGLYDVTVIIQLTNGKLTSVVANGPDETAGLGTRPLVLLPEAMLAKNSIKVDTISGATETSEAVLLAAARALGKAGLTDADLKR